MQFRARLVNITHEPEVRDRRHGTVELDGGIRRFRRHARAVGDHRPVLWLRLQTEHRLRLPAGRQAHVRLSDHHVVGR